MIIKQITICSILLVAYSAVGQSSQAKLLLKQDSIYEANIKKTHISGVYIPEDLSDSFRELIRLSPAASLDKMASAPEAMAAQKLHLGLGKWMAHNWSFYEGSRFSAYLRSLGVSYPDDMIEFTIISFHRHLNKVALELDQRAKSYSDKREKELADRLKTAKTISRRKKN